MRKPLNEVIPAGQLFLHSPLHRALVQCLLHNQLHGTHPPQPKHHDFSPALEPHPLENARPAKYNSCCGTEGRGFKPRRSPQIFQAHRDSVLVRTTQLEHKPGSNLDDSWVGGSQNSSKCSAGNIRVRIGEPGVVNKFRNHTSVKTASAAHYRLSVKSHRCSLG
jgi:hypothetical protein